jgi:Helix-turn-helix domain
VATAGSGRLARRKAERRIAGGSSAEPPASPPADVGSDLRRARESMGLGLAEVRDRTGIRWQHLEALEELEVGNIPDQRTLVVAARRYADVVGLDATEVCGAVLAVWERQTASRASAPMRGPNYGPGGSSPISSPPSSAHSPPATASGRRRPSVAKTDSVGKERDARPTGAQTQVHPASPAQPHLLAFRQTAEVPSVSSRSKDRDRAAKAFEDTGSVPVLLGFPAAILRTPRWLRATVTISTVALLLAAGGLAIAHFEPAWTSALHLTHARSTTSTSSVGSSQGHTNPSGARQGQQVVSPVQSNGATGSVVVHAASYQVTVTAGNRCWVQATVPTQTSGPIYAQVLPAGQSTVLDAAAGQLSVQVGASLVTLHVQVAGKTVPNWSFTPEVAPFTLNFASASAS